MTQGDGAAVDVDLVQVPFQVLGHGQRLRGESFVGFDQVQLTDVPASLVQATASGRHRADAHDRRVDARVGVSGDFCQYRQAQSLGFFGAHQDHGGGTVVQRRSVAGAHRTVLLEGRLEFAQGFGGGAGPWLLVGGEGQRIALALRDQDRRDFIDEAPGFDGGHGFLLRGGGERVLLLAAQAVLLGQVLGGDAHVVIVERIPQAIADHGVDDLRVTHAQAGTGAGHDVIGQAHVFLATGDDHVSVAATNRLSAQVQGLEAGAADLVQGHRRHSKRQAGLDRSLARRVLPGAGGQHLTHDHFIDFSRVEAGLCQQLTDHRSAQVDGRNIGQGTLETADRGARGGNNDDFLHGMIPHWAANCISGTWSGTISLPAVLATISSTLTPGARSFRMNAPFSISR
ncbi:hypothetical protein D3C86_1247780 [compost metagenome]